MISINFDTSTVSFVQYFVNTMDFLGLFKLFLLGCIIFGFWYFYRKKIAKDSGIHIQNLNIYYDNNAKTKK